MKMKKVLNNSAQPQKQSVTMGGKKGIMEKHRCGIYPIQVNSSSGAQQIWV